MIISFTGHRPNKLKFAYEPNNPLKSWVSNKTKELLEQLKPDKCISGVAVGFDQWAAWVCVELNIPFIAAVPFIGQDAIWPAASRKEYAELLDLADDVVIVSRGAYAGWKLQKRNEYLVDHCDAMIALWNGTAGGTANCVAYAKQHDKKIHLINPNDFVSTVE